MRDQIIREKFCYFFNNNKYFGKFLIDDFNIVHENSEKCIETEPYIDHYIFYKLLDEFYGIEVSWNESEFKTVLNQFYKNNNIAFCDDDNYLERLIEDIKNDRFKIL